jgi:hypothetical protein
MEKYEKPVMEVESFGFDVILTSEGPGDCADELPIMPIIRDDPNTPDFG